MARKPRAEMIEETRAKLIDAARRAFADNGYAGASMDELTASAGLTRGALYHHFGDKKGLLAAVVQQIDDEMNLRLGAILAAGEDLWSGFRAYNRAYLEMALEAEIQRIVLRDAPAILGSPSSEASQLRCLSSMTGQLRELMDSGRVRRTDAEALAWLLNGALVDAALRIANAEHPPESLARACQALDVLLDPAHGVKSQWTTASEPAATRTPRCSRPSSAQPGKASACCPSWPGSPTPGSPGWTSIAA
ncbi:putative transcriptional regulator [Pseudomonas aeruginosa PADK2_CF510]|nr:putative transcriptional regulator [Pseudomonas aeruginosa PADK2_CF510]